MESITSKVTSLRFSRDHQYLSVGTTTGYKIFSFNPTSLQLEKKVENGVKLVIPCPNKTIVTFVQRGQEGKKGQEVVIYDHSGDMELAKMKFSKEIIDVRYFKFTLVIVQVNVMKVIKINDVKNVKVIATAENLFGACGISRCIETDKDNSTSLQMIACPGADSDADVFVVNIEDDTRYSFFPGYSSNNYIVTALELNSQGTQLAAATTEGKSIDIFDVQNMAKLYSMSRGLFSKHIDFLSFQQNDKELIVSSLDGAVHLFFLLTPEEIKEQEKKSTLLTAAYNFAFPKDKDIKFRVNNEQAEIEFDSDKKYISCKIDEGIIMTVSNSGYLYLGSFKEGDGEAKIEEIINYLAKE